ncbi:hypothetical protein OE749_12220 [Aestuariibacter sp. AA17]|uniref:ADP-heptose--LPS heptosyltransferase 2 n=1 Tax=Fluctibacter corallii TaxID=2984329 RepID=A0ABT3A9W0_9ALTE|nr:hypothetical protein [Aestuariibacter sp. AA17]MCV2885461.1 hypothetical protein [Aestuariibacter sp. AA17]
MTDMRQSDKILIIRMQDFADVLSIGVPAIRHIKQSHEESDVHFLTFGHAADMVALAEPNIQVHKLETHQWPPHLLQAMESFLGLAEQIIGEGFTKIINLDTSFMPCFLAKFLKDAGQRVEGNFITLSVQELIEQFQAQTLKPEYVTDPTMYMQSTWFGMTRWYTEWWHGEYLPENGYPEFYLRKCCDFEDIQFDMSVEVKPDESVKSGNEKPVIALATDSLQEGVHYPYGMQLKIALKEAGFSVWEVPNQIEDATAVLAKLSASSLLVCVPGSAHWLAASVGCPVLSITGAIDPRTLMPDYATEESDELVTSESLVESVLSIFDEPVHDD